MSMMKQFLVMNYWLWGAAGVPDDLWASEDWAPDGELGQSLAAAHDAWSEVVRRDHAAMGKGELVEIVAKDGAENWKKLAALLEGTPYHAKCTEFVEKGEDWPFENEAGNVEGIYNVFKTIIWMWKYGCPIFLIIIILAVVVYVVDDMLH